MHSPNAQPVHETALRYYAQPGSMTAPGQYAACFDGLPADIPALCEVVQGVLLHTHWAAQYGVALSLEREHEVNIRPTEAMLARIRALDDRPITIGRPLAGRLVGNCRHFATLLCAMLRHLGIPARARCGFGAYFLPGSYEDHWVCEYWNAAAQRWVLVDAQIDAFQQNCLQLSFDPHDVPRGQFVIAGQAWQRCRAQQADPRHFGIFDMRGLWFISGNVLRDLAALNRIELLPWDCWGLMQQSDAEIPEEDRALLDHVAALTLAGDEAFAEIRALYEGDPRLRVPPVIRSYVDGQLEAVAVLPT